MFSSLQTRLRSFAWSALGALADLPADTVDVVLGKGSRLPPRRLRKSAGTSERRAFMAAGLRAAREILRAASWTGVRSDTTTRILDFGCGCGRVAAVLQESWPSADIYGVDAHEAAVKWCAQYLSGHFQVLDKGGQLPLADATFELVYANNVFTHMNEPEQCKWLAEIHRVLRPAGIFVATTCSPELAIRYLPPSEQVPLQARGFAFSPGSRGFNGQVAFQSADYLRREWSPWFEMLDHKPFGTVTRDFSIFRRQ